MPRRVLRDARTLAPAAQEEKRRTAVRLRQAGQSFVAIGGVLGVHYMTVSGWWDRFPAGGLEALAAQRRGRRVGTQRTLTAAQERTIQRLVSDRTPEQLRLPFALWTRAAIGQLMQARYGLRMPVRTIGHYLRRWGFTPQKPLKRAYEQRPEAIQRWLETEYPAIAARAKREGAEIHWGDETSLSTSDPRGRGLRAARADAGPHGRRAPEGRELPLEHHESRARALHGAPRGARCADAHPLHAPLDPERRPEGLLHSRQLERAQGGEGPAWVAAHADDIAVFYLPPYAPELNPDEYLNGDLKLAVAARVPARTKPELTKAARSHLRTLQRRPSRVRCFFHHPRISYAA